MNGVTGRMGTNQHLLRSILAIREQGGIAVGAGEALWPEPTLVGRDDAQARPRSPSAHGLDATRPTSTQALADRTDDLLRRPGHEPPRGGACAAAIAAGKHVYCEKPLTEDLDAALALARRADAAGIKHGVVQDKLFLPGMPQAQAGCSTAALLRAHLSRARRVRLLGLPRPRPGAAAAVVELPRARTAAGSSPTCSPTGATCSTTLFGPVRGVFALGATHLPDRDRRAGRALRRDRRGRGLRDLRARAAASIAQMNSSWCVRVDRDELFELQVDGTEGSAVAGLRECRLQPARGDAARRSGTRTCPDPIDHRDGVDRRARAERARQRLQGAVGAVPAPRRARRAVPVGLPRGRARRAARPSSAMQLVARAALGRRAGAVTL